MEEEDKRYDPADLSPHLGRTFVTKNSHYSISSDGRLLGRPSIEGAKVLHVAGVESQHYWSFVDALDSKQRFNALILEHGQRPRAGLRLVVGLPDDETRRNGFITSQLKPEGE